LNTSLNLRLLIATTITLAVFLGSAGLILDSAFQSSARTAVEHRLQGQVYSLLGAADLDTKDQLYLPNTLPEARYSQPGSGLYAQVSDINSKEIWRSPSALDLSLAPFAMIAVGTSAFEETAIENNGSMFVYQFTVAWERGAPGAGSDTYMFTILESRAAYLAEVAAFRQTLWLWLGMASVLLVLVQGSILAWSLAPLRRVAAEIKAVETGQQQALANDYPREISALTRNLNALLINERRQLERYQNTMADLAHSLKTPLAVLRGWLESRHDNDDTEEMNIQLERMRSIIDYQLGRSSSTRKTFLQPVALAPAIKKVLDSLHKVYHDKGIIDHISLAPDLVFYGSEGDLLEILGNLLDNACKYCHREIYITSKIIPGKQRDGIEITIADDGPGIKDSVRQQVLQRGIRMDTQKEGQGIGLAIVHEIIAAYDGRIEIDEDENQCNRIVVCFYGV
jgi:two-component system sensor histidine kinase PhoQ